MPTVKQLEDKVQGLITKQQDIIGDDSTPWSERADGFAAVEADVKSALAELAAVKGVNDLERLFNGGSEAQGVGGAPETGNKSIGQQVTEAEGFKAIVGRKGSSGFTSGQIEVKALNTTDPVNPGVLPATHLGGVVDIRFRRLTVRDLLLQGSMDNAAITYLVETAVTNAAAAVARGALKPESALTLDSRIEPAKKIATVLKTEDEILDDLAFARSYIDGRLRTFVQLTEEDQLLNGSGTGANIQGLLNRSGLATAVTVAASNDTREEAIFRQVTAIRTTAFVDPDAVVIHPTDWQAIRLRKDANGQFYAGGPFTGPYGSGGIVTSESLWGLPVVVTPAIAAGKSFVGAFGSAAQVLQRTGLTVEATNTDQDDFVKNRVTFRAEERLALAVYRPGAFGVVQPV